MHENRKRKRKKDRLLANFLTDSESGKETKKTKQKNYLHSWNVAVTNRISLWKLSVIK